MANSKSDPEPTEGESLSGELSGFNGATRAVALLASATLHGNANTPVSEVIGLAREFENYLDGIDPEPEEADAPEEADETA